jgi:hypothetical protein
MSELSEAEREAIRDYHERRKKVEPPASERQPESKKPEKEKGPPQAEILIALAADADLFHTPDGKAYADIQNNRHRETRAVRSKAFRQWLATRYYKAKGGAPNSEAMQSALGVIEGRAVYEGSERKVFVRVAGHNSKIYIDLGDDAWRAIEIDTKDWRVVSDPPVRFRRASGMKPLPEPARGGTIGALKPFLNIDAGFELIVFWLLAALRDRGPYPILAISGEQGSAKSTFAGILRSLVDPNTAPLRALPREDRDLFIAANNGHLLTFDNVSGLPHWISDTLCRLATGGGFAVRQMYSDDDEVLFDACRPVILNGIEDIVTRPDLADRAIFLTLEQIAEEDRKAEAKIWADFEIVQPKILGALLDAMVVGLKKLPDTRLPKLPRMADFALWATACETATWKANTFWDAYCSNQDEAAEGVLDSDPVADAMRKFMAARETEWTGTAATLLGALKLEAGEDITREKSWPKHANALSRRLRRSVTFLRKTGIEISYGRGRARREITIRKADQNIRVKTSSPLSSPSPTSKINDLPATMKMDRDDTDRHRDDSAPFIVAPKPLKNNACDDGDGRDDQSPPILCQPTSDDDLSIPTFLKRTNP